MGVREALGLNGKADAAKLLESRAAEMLSARDRYTQAAASADLTIEQHREAIAELEFALEDIGWIRMEGESAYEFSRDGLMRIVRLARLMFLKNPLIRRAIMVQSYYVFGQGVEISARNEGINKVLQDFIEDRRNRRELTGQQAMEANEVALQADGNLFFAFFDPPTGPMQIRLVPVDEITEIITNPEDRTEPWFYLRSWNASQFDPSRGSASPMQTTKRYYADLGIFRAGGYPDREGRLQKLPPKIGDIEVDTVPLMHVKVGGLRHMRFGLPDVYAALDWARAYKAFLEDWSSLVSSLQRFAYKVSTKGSKVGAAKDKLNSALEPDLGTDSNPPPVTGGIFVGEEGTDITAVPKTGATISSDDARALRTMVAAATDIPDTILAGDPDMGTLATAKTLDRPTELAMHSRQMLWESIFSDILDYVVSVAVRKGDERLPLISDATAPGGYRLADKANPEDDSEPVDSEGQGDDVDQSIDVAFPPVLEPNIKEAITAIVEAATLMGNPAAGTLPNKLVTQLLAVTLGVSDVDEVVAEMYPSKTTADPAATAADQQATAQNPQAQAFAAALRDLQEAVRDLTAREPMEVDADDLAAAGFEVR